MRPLAVLLIVLVLGATAAMIAVSRLEERDTFCLRCHLAPETRYVEQAQLAVGIGDPFLVPDLASFHYWAAVSESGEEPFRCIDCHRGDGQPVHRLQVLALASADTVTWALGQADETISKGDVANSDPEVSSWQGPERYNREPHILNAGCRRCHQDTLTLVGFDNHFHNRLPAAVAAFADTGMLFYPENWSQPAGTGRLLQPDETVLTCLDCHRAHVAGFETDYYLDSDRVVLPACEQCHLETQRGPLDLIN
jgi:hypothetical protein